MKKALIFRVLKGIKKTETPINQGISAVLPKLYLGGASVHEGLCFIFTFVFGYVILNIKRGVFR